MHCDATPGFLILAMFTVALGASCAGRPDTSFPSSDGDAGDGGADGPLATDSTTNPDAVTSAVDAAFEASGPAAQVRIANWSPDAPASGYDVCLAIHGSSSWSGPLLAQLIGDAGVLGDAAVASVQFPGVTNFLLAIAPGTYDVAVVADGAGCASPVAATTDLPALVVGGWYTLAIVGDGTPAGGDPALSVVVFTDDSTNALGTGVRFLNVAPSIAAVDFGQGTLATGFVPLAVAVPFAGIATMTAGDAGTTPDSNGYVGVPTVSGVSFSAHASTGDGGDLAVAPNVTLVPAPTATVALVGGKTGGAAPQLLVCTWDGVANESSGLESSCVVASM
jgi:hypothetical protein